MVTETMPHPVRPDEVVVASGHSGRGLQVTCDVCGTLNWNHIELQICEWKCRNCGRVLTSYFPGLVKQVLEREAAKVKQKETVPES